ncbi:MAG: YbhB/YbcL family Raf kinase inhibitor-like protein [Candidatus Acidiferrales bacterium]
MTLSRIFIALFIIVLVFAVGLPFAHSHAAADRQPITQDALKQSADTLQLSSASFEADAAIPAKYTCDGENVSPALLWNNPPPATRSFALVVDDPDAPNGTVVHWLIYDIPADTHGLQEGVPKDKKLRDGTLQGRNSHGKIGYSGPCPPHGAVHHYFFKLYALDNVINLKPNATEPQLEQAIKDHILGKAQLIGRFEH